MKLTVLGRYGTYPAKNGGTASYILNDGNINIILDMGCSSLSRLQNFLTLNDIDAIILSHLHSDHIADLLVLRYMADKLTNECLLQKKLKIYCPDTPENEFKIISSCKAFDINIITENAAIILGKLNISFFKMKHSVDSFGIRVDNGEKVFVYTGDTVMNENLIKLINGADVVLGDCAILPYKKKDATPHLTVKELAEITYKAGNTLYTAHLSAGDEDKIFEEASKINPKTVLIEELKTYVI